jgi:cytosine/adenosine deaminase-related metal-dependent hydrolase
VESRKALRTLVKPRYLIAFRDGAHRMVEGGALLIEDDRVVFIGRSYDGSFDQVIEAPGHLVCPGFICTHFHAHVPLIKDYFEDQGKRHFYMGSGPLTETIGMQTPDEARVSARYSAVEAIKCGTTTVVDLFLPGAERQAVLETYGQMGLRAYVIAQHQSATWVLQEAARLGYRWDERKGVEQLEHSIAFVREFDGSFDGRICCMLGPAQVDTCSPDLLRKTRAAADRLGVGIEIVGLQSVDEFREIVARHGVTPVEYLHQAALLGPDLIIGHGVFVAGHSWTLFPPGRDLELLAKSGTSVAHSVTIFARSGIAMESFGRYIAAGVNVSIGMDICPRDMFEHMRDTVMMSKVVDRNAETATALDVFNAATLGGARALRRDDLGRLAQGAKADLFFLNLQSVRTAPVWDPLRMLVYSADRDDVDHVMIDGRFVMRDGEVPGVDERQLATEIEAAQQSLMSRVPEQNAERRTARELSPCALEAW